jgi:small subunit ribosomal protein S19
MSRSNFKGPFPFFNPKTLQQSTQNNNNQLQNATQVHRQNVILPNDISSTFSINNGKKWVNLIVNEDMLGLKFGSFVFSRSSYKFKKKKR